MNEQEMKEKKMKRKRQAKRRRQVKTALLTVTALCLCVGMVWGVGTLKHRTAMNGNNALAAGDEAEPKATKSLEIDPNAGEYVPPATPEPIRGVAIPGWGSLTIPAGETEDIVVDFYNPEENADYYYLTFELRLPYLPDGSEQTGVLPLPTATPTVEPTATVEGAPTPAPTEEPAPNYEVLYTSGLIPPGLHIQHITLAHALEAGEYEAVIHVQPYKMNEELTSTNNADLVTKLIVKGKDE